MTFEPLFTLQEQDGSKAKKYKCNLCSKKNLISVTSSSNWALKRHLSTIHNKEDVDKFEKICQKNKTQGPHTTKHKQKGLETFGFTKESTEQFEKHQACKVTQENVDKAIVDFIMCESLPFTMVRKEGFRNLIKTCQPAMKVMSYETLMKKMSKNFSAMKINLRKEFEQTDHICITADLWTGSKRGYLGVTAHWLDVDLNRISCGLACKRMKGSHTFDTIATSIESILLEFGLQNKCHSGTLN